MPAERKSTRLANRPTQAPKLEIAVSDDYESEYSSSSDSEVYEDEVVGPKKKRAGSKRKYKASSSTKQPPSKKPRGMKGLLKDVVDMPLDILYEIFGHVLPVDLLNLARTSKDLRKILLNRSSAFVWRNARANDPYGLPECPSDISEPAYASLCYARHCTSCYCATPSPYYIFGARLRLCRKCVDKQFKNLPDWLSRHKLTKVFKTLPQVELVGQPLHKRLVFYAPTVERLCSVVQNVIKKHQDYKIWTAELGKLKFVRQMRKKNRHAIACAKWLKDRNADIESQKTSLLDARRAEVMEYAKGLGWSEELLKFDDAIEAIKDDSMISKVCSKKITPQALESIKDTLVVLLDKIKREHTVWKIKTLLKRRLPLLRNIRDDCSKLFHPRTPIVSTRDLFHLPAVHDLIMDPPLDADVTVDTLNPIRQNFGAYMAQVQGQQKETLLKMIKTVYGPEHEVDDTVFDLATTLFRCSRCPYSEIRLPRALVHKCALGFFHLHRDNPQLSLQEDTETASLLLALLQSRWNEANIISFDKDMASVIGDVVELCGFDPKSATVDEVEMANPILECMSCNNIYKGRTTMKWSTTVHHFLSRHSNADDANSGQSTMVLKVLDEPEASYVRSQMNILKEKAYSAQNSERCVCIVCHLPGSMPFLKAHWKAEHGGPPEEGDIIPRLDMAYDFDEFMLWPPRDPDELALSLSSGTEITLKT